MVPIEAFLVVLFVAIGWSMVAGVFLHKAIIRHKNRVNPFDAYSDAQLEVLRERTAGTARWRLEKGRATAKDALTYLTQIHQEIERRRRDTSVAEKAKRKGIDEFDLVYEAVLHDIETREKK